MDRRVKLFRIIFNPFSLLQIWFMYSLSVINFEMLYWLLSFSHSFIFAFSGSLLIQTSEIPLIASAAHVIIFTSDTDFLPFWIYFYVSFPNLMLIPGAFPYLVTIDNGHFWSCWLSWQELQISNSETVCSSCSGLLSFLGSVDRYTLSCNLPMSWTRGNNAFQHPELVLFILSSGCSVLFPF